MHRGAPGLLVLGGSGAAQPKESGLCKALQDPHVYRHCVGLQGFSTAPQPPLSSCPAELGKLKVAEELKLYLLCHAPDFFFFKETSIGLGAAQPSCIIG